MGGPQRCRDESTFDPLTSASPGPPWTTCAAADAAANAEVVRRVLAGDQGPVRDAVVLNAAAALVANDVSADAPLLDRLAGGLERANEAIDSGAAAGALERWIDAASQPEASGRDTARRAPDASRT